MSGSKNVILIIDVSGSMKDSRFEKAKQIAEDIINTLSNNDFLGVIAFSDNATRVYSNTMIRATE